MQFSLALSRTVCSAASVRIIKLNKKANLDKNYGNEQKGGTFDILNMMVSIL